jgi:hypothetical protein
MKVNQTEHDDKSNANLRNDTEYRIEYENELPVITSPPPKKKDDIFDMCIIMWAVPFLQGLSQLQMR